jgi:DNA-binding transcriptional ArsR family regulator
MARPPFDFQILGELLEQGRQTHGSAPSIRRMLLPASGRVQRLTGVPYFDIFRSVKALPMSRLQARDAHVEAFKALAHQSRLQIFFFLVKAGTEVAAGDIQAQLEIPGPTLSHHLDVLRRAGLLQSRREERYVYYSPRAEMVSELVRILTACC